jgi:hypothetical protein
MLPQDRNLGILQPIIGSWYEPLRKPEESQKQVLSELVKE